jgi:hypothetical protein
MNANFPVVLLFILNNQISIGTQWRHVTCTVLSTTSLHQAPLQNTYICLVPWYMQLLTYFSQAYDETGETALPRSSKLPVTLAIHLP